MLTVTEVPSNTQLVALADAVFDETSPYDGVGFRNHCTRLYHFATMLMERAGATLPRDLAYLVAMVHDLGIVTTMDDGDNYLQRSRALFHRVTQDVVMPDVDPDLVDECLLFNHRLRPVAGVCRQAECFRRAVIIEHTRGHMRYGLPAGPVREVFAHLPRGNFDRVLLDFTWRTLRREPRTLVDGIFL